MELFNGSDETKGISNLLPENRSTLKCSRERGKVFYFRLAFSLVQTFTRCTFSPELMLDLNVG